MKIGILVYPHYDFPPDGYGPMQTVACELANGLAKKGHEVSIFATADAKLSNNLTIIPTKDTCISKDSTVPDPKIYEFSTIQKVLEHRNDFDILSSHIGFHILPFLEFLNYPVVVNLQGTYSNEHYRKFINQYQKANFVSISLAQQKELPGIKFAANVYHGINVEKFPFKETSESHFSFLGRVSLVKGLDIAIDVAKATDQRLKIGAKYDTNNSKEKEFFTQKIEPYLNDKIEFLGEQDFSQKIDLLLNSRALLFPIQWEEAFGLVMVEAMACGTPVIAFDRGSVLEIVKDGETGFICPAGDTDAMIEAVKRINEMSEEDYKKMRRNCRRHVEENFTVEKMVDNYEQLFKKILNNKENI